MSIWFRPAGMAMESCGRIAQYLNAKRIKYNGSQYRYRSSHRIVNWGRSDPAHYPISINQPEAVRNAVHKRLTWDLLANRGITTVSYTDDPGVAEAWLESGIHVYRRETTSSFGGRGIRVLHDCEDLRQGSSGDLPCELYTKGIPIHREFRVIVVDGTAVLVKEKKKRRGTEPDPFIRSHGDWVFCLNDLRPYPAAITENSVRAVQTLGLDFGGVDVILDPNGITHVLEVNSAPGLNGSAVGLVAEALVGAIGRRD